ncbi:hypothetical protein ACFYYB_28070 [Streptomyces sp. NPDC002886]|uniref:hypothetical protein n=1 Tax=Streptomyces sp. NPDC002886 TaxID=3364667 RepID=UPI00368B71CB
MAFTVKITDYDPANHPLTEWDKSHHRVYTDDSDEVGTPKYEHYPTDPTKLTFYPDTGLEGEIDNEHQVTGPASALLTAKSAYVPPGGSWTFYTEEDFHGEEYGYTNDSQIAHVLDFDPQCSSVLRGVDS